LPRCHESKAAGFQLRRWRRRRIEQRPADGDDAISHIFEPHANQQESLQRTGRRHIKADSRFHDMLERKEQLI
jgi:hypothetical protein